MSIFMLYWMKSGTIFDVPILVKINFRFLFFAVCLSCGKMSAQDSAFYFCSKIADDSSGKPIAYAQISLTGTLRSVTANEKGEFCILVNKKRSVLEISAPWYFTKEIAVPMVIRPSGHILLKAFPNQGTPLIEGTVETVFRDSAWRVIDYDFYDSLILLLLNNPRLGLSKIIAQNKELVSLASLAVKGNVQKFYTDCRGKHYVIKDETAAQFFIDKQRGIFVAQESNLRSFEKETLNCIAEDATSTYVALTASPDYILSNTLDLKIKYKTLSYFSIAKEKKQRALFKNFSDDKVYKPAFGDKTYLDMGLIRLPFSNRETKVMKVNCPLIRAGKNLCMFDFPGNRIESYDSVGRLTDYSLMYFSSRDNWCGQVYPDNATGKFYTCFYINPTAQNKKTGWYTLAHTELSEINISTGQISNSFILPLARPVQLKVQDGYVYFTGTKKGKDRFYPLHKVKIDKLSKKFTGE